MNKVSQFQKLNVSTFSNNCIRKKRQYKTSMKEKFEKKIGRKLKDELIKIEYSI